MAAGKVPDAAPKQKVNRPQKDSDVDFSVVQQMPTFEDCYPNSTKASYAAYL